MTLDLRQIAQQAQQQQAQQMMVKQFMDHLTLQTACNMMVNTCNETLSQQEKRVLAERIKQQLAEVLPYVFEAYGMVKVKDEGEKDGQ